MLLILKRFFRYSLIFMLGGLAVFILGDLVFSLNHPDLKPWHTLKVVVEEEGFRWKDELYPSLSATARATASWSVTSAGSAMARPPSPSMSATVSVISYTASSRMVTAKVCSVTPGSKYNVPLAATKSWPSTAVPFEACQVTVRGSTDALEG